MFGHSYLSNNENQRDAFLRFTRRLKALSVACFGFFSIVGALVGASELVLCFGGRQWPKNLVVCGVGTVLWEPKEEVRLLPSVVAPCTCSTLFIRARFRVIKTGCRIYSRELYVRTSNNLRQWRTSLSKSKCLALTWASKDSLGLAATKLWLSVS